MKSAKYERMLIARFERNGISKARNLAVFVKKRKKINKSIIILNENANRNTTKIDKCRNSSYIIIHAMHLDQSNINN